MNLAVSSGHKGSVMLAYSDEEPLQASGQSLVVDPGPDLNLHCLVQDTALEMAKRLRSILDRLMEKLSSRWQQRGFRPEDRLVLSLPGVSSPRDRDVGEQCVRAAGWPITEVPNYYVIDDTFAGLIAGAKSTRGICAVAGTGASVYMGTPDGSIRAYKPGKPFKLDGFGAMLGDHGSGFRLAMTTLEKICRYIDVRKTEAELEQGSEVTAILEELVRKMQLTNDQIPSGSFLQNWIDDLLANRTPEWRIKIAELAEVITSAAETENAFAQSCVEEAAEGMVKTLRTALDTEDFEDMHGAPIYCQGGMFRHSPFYRERVENLLRRDGKNNPIELARYCAPVGALLVAASPSWTVPDADTQEAIERAIDSVPSDYRNLLFNTPAAVP